MIVIDDPDDPRVAVLRTNDRGLSNRPQRLDDSGDGLFMAEGDLVVQRALDAGCRPVVALVDAANPPQLAQHLAQRIDVFAGGPAVRAAITKLGAPAPIVALFERPSRPSVDELAARSARLVLVEAVDNPVNIGGIARNALGLGWHGLILDQTSADPLARRALRVSMGHALRLPHARTLDLAGAAATLRDSGWTVCALTPSDDSTDLDRVEPADRIALVVGSERAGLSDATLAAATLRVRIPMHEQVDSLNAAAATAVACWHLRQR